MADLFKKLHKTAPGGYKCPCCGPMPKDRPAARRAVRQRLKRETEKEINESIKKEK